MKVRTVSVIAIIVFLTTTACQMLLGASTQPPTEGEGYVPSSSEGIDMGVNAEWPAYIPAEIPVLDGDIRLVMGDADTKVRIFYDSLSDKQVEQYIKTCEAVGYSVEYQVYVQEGFPDTSDEKLKAGDYDAIDFTKGDYHMRLEAGSDTATLDIYLNQSSRQSSPTRAPLPWPEDITVSVPQPQGCSVRNIANLSYGGYQINCEYANGDMQLDAYLQLLAGLGFVETDRLLNDTDEIVYIMLESSDQSVKVMPHQPSSTVTLQITPLTP